MTRPSYITGVEIRQNDQGTLDIVAYNADRLHAIFMGNPSLMDMGAWTSRGSLKLSDKLESEGWYVRYNPANHTFSWSGPAEELTHIQQVILYTEAARDLGIEDAPRLEGDASRLLQRVAQRAFDYGQQRERESPESQHPKHRANVPSLEET